VVAGTTTGGAASYLKLYQFAAGGNGGNSISSIATRGGAGGAARSSLTFDDTKNTKHAPSVTGTVGAYGGAGGSGTTGGAGGAATASLTLTGALNVTATSEAIGGTGGPGAHGGNAKATSDAIGTTSITSHATADGGNGGARAGTASATAIGEGASGDANAAATSGSITSGSLVTASIANADAPVAGTSTAETWAAIGKGAISALVLVLDQALAQITAEPKASDVAAITRANSNINTAFTTSKTPTYFGISELGGEYSPSASGSETETSSVHMTVDLTKAGTLQDLVFGFYSGTATGLDVKINGTDHITNFTTVTDANNFFQNNAVDYGALSGTSLQLDISLSITEAAAGGYDFGMLIGDPPPASSSSPASGGGSGGGAAVAPLGHMAASFSSSAAANLGGAGSVQQDNLPPLATPHAMT
jgi:hypothetical protein